MSKTIAFTGKRPKDLYGYENSTQYSVLFDHLVEHLHHLYINNDVRTFISGGAQGFDQIAFWAVETLKSKYNLNDIVNAVHIPFIGQESRWAKTGLFSQEEYHWMTDRADELKIVNNNVDTSDFKTVVKVLNDRNESMVNDADIVFGLFDAATLDFHSNKSGTANCLRYAEKMGRDIYIMTPTNFDLYTVKDGATIKADI